MDASPLGRIVIAGVNGRFGRIFARKLAQAGAEVCGLDLQAGAAEPSACPDYVQASLADMGEAAERAVAEAQYVLLCVPEEVILQSLPQLARLAPPDALLMDIASVKTRIGAAVAALELEAGYLSLHPMFGPMDDFSDRAVCLTPLRDSDKAGRIAALFAGWGARVSTLSPEQHDRATSLVQALPHAALIAFGAALGAGGADFELAWAIATPIQKIMLALAARVVGSEHDTYWSIQSANPFARAARDALETELRALSATIEGAGLPEFSQTLESVRGYFGESEEALQELAARLTAIAK